MSEDIVFELRKGIIDATLARRAAVEVDRLRAELTNAEKARDEYLRMARLHGDGLVLAQAEIARLREALETARPHIATLEWNSEGEYGGLVKQIDDALAYHGKE